MGGLGRRVFGKEHRLASSCCDLALQNKGRWGINLFQVLSSSVGAGLKEGCTELLGSPSACCKHIPPPGNHCNCWWLNNIYSVLYSQNLWCIQKMELTTWLLFTSTPLSSSFPGISSLWLGIFSTSAPACMPWVCSCLLFWPFCSTILPCLSYSALSLPCHKSPYISTPPTPSSWWFWSILVLCNGSCPALVLLLYLGAVSGSRLCFAIWRFWSSVLQNGSAEQCLYLALSFVSLVTKAEYHWKTVLVDHVKQPGE